jgi:hypothetical protein
MWAADYVSPRADLTAENKRIFVPSRDQQGQFKYMTVMVKDIDC